MSVSRFFLSLLFYSPLSDLSTTGVISHLHLDHLGYAGKGGFWALMEQFEVTFDKVLDRDSGIWVDQVFFSSLPPSPFPT